MKIVSRLAIIAALLVFPVAAQAGGLAFEEPFQLPHGNPDQHPFLNGGEPSIGFDPSGDGHVYVTAPQSVPSVVNPVAGISDSPQGVGYWASADHGKTWPISGNTGSLIGGGDSDVEVLPNHRVLVADLEAVAAAICSSSDFGATFPDCNGGVVGNQQGPENDREWLTRGAKPNEVFLTYHDFVGGYPIIEKSTDGGKTFAPCGLILDPLGPAARNYTPLGGTLVSKPVVDKDGTIYVEFATPDITALPVGAALDHLYMAVAHGCTTTTRFTDHLIYEDPGADLGKIFQQEAMDGSGRLYVVASGQIAAGRATSDTFLFTSGDHGQTWSKPIKVNPPELKANVFPAVAAGAHAGEALVGWFGSSTSGDPNNGKDQWRFYAAATYDGGQTFNVAQVTKNPIHYGDICTAGLFCGLIPGAPSNRNLADFASAAVDPDNGCGMLAIPGDPYNRPDLPDGKDNAASSAYVSRQVGTGTCFTAENSGKAASLVGSSTAGSTCVDRAAPQTHPRRSSLRASRKGFSIRGSASDRGCGKSGKGALNRVAVGLARVAGTKCRYLRANGSLRAPADCGKPLYHAARGTTSWSYSYRHRLRPGRYVAWFHSVDKAGNAERLIRKRNLVRFRVR
jgi:hypothetical protein